MARPLAGRSYLNEIVRLLQPLYQPSLTTDLCSNLIMRKTSSRKERNLLSSSNRIHDINGRNSSLYHFFWVSSLTRIDWTTWKFSQGTWNIRIKKPYLVEVIKSKFKGNPMPHTWNIQVCLRKDGRTIVNWFPRSIKNAPKHVQGDWSFQDLPQGKEIISMWQAR